MVWQQVMGSTVQDTNPGNGRTFSLLQNVQTVFGSPQASYWVGTGNLSLGYSGWVTRLTTHLHLVLRLGMSGAMLLLPLYAFMVCTGTALPLQYFSLLWYCVMAVKFHADMMQ